MSTLRIKDAPLLPNVDGSEKIPTGGRGDYSVSVDQIKTFAQGGLPQKIEDHINDTENPHQVTKEQVGLGNVDNTSDVDKPISTATQEVLDLKANQSTTYTKTEVDFSLGLKANKTYVDSRDLLKADKTYVDSALAGFSNGAAKFYPTLAAANADIANIALKDKVEVGEAANGGTWYKATAGATSLTKSGYDPLMQAKAYVDSNPLFKPVRVVNDTTATIDLDSSEYQEGYFVFTNTPYSPTHLNFPYYGDSTGSRGSGVLIAVKDSGGTLVRQMFITPDNLYFRATFNGVFEPWIKTVIDKDLVSTLDRYLRKSINVDVNADFNSLLLEDGFHVVQTIATAQTITGIPEQRSGVLQVNKINATNIHQKFSSASNKIYERHWINNQWSPWVEITTTANFASVLSPHIPSVLKHAGIDTSRKPLAPYQRANFIVGANQNEVIFQDITNAPVGARSVVVPVMPNKTYTIVKQLSERFRIATFPQNPERGAIGTLLKGELDSHVTKGNHRYFTFTTGLDAAYLVLYVSYSMSEEPVAEMYEGAYVDFYFEQTKFTKEVLAPNIVRGKNLAQDNWIRYVLRDTDRVPDGWVNSDGATLLVDVKPNTTYTVSRQGGDRFRLALFQRMTTGGEYPSLLGGNRILVGTSDGNPMGPYTFTTGSEEYIMAAYLTSNVANYGYPDWVQVEEGSIATPYESYGFKFSPAATTAPTETPSGGGSAYDFAGLGDANFISKAADTAGAWVDAAYTVPATDDTNTLQALFDKAKKGVVSLEPNKKYKITRPIRFNPEKVKLLKGNMAHIVCIGDIEAFQMVGSLSSSASASGMNRSLAYNEMSPLVVALKITNPMEVLGTAFVVNKVMSPNFLACNFAYLRRGIVFRGINRNAILSSNHIYACSDYGIHFEQGGDLHQINIIGNHISYCRKNIFSENHHIYNIQITGGDIETSSYPTLEIGGAAECNMHFLQTTAVLEDLEIVGNTIEDHWNTSRMIRLEGDPTSTSKISCVTISGNVTGNSSGSVIEIGGASGVEILGQFKANGGYVVDVIGDLNGFKLSTQSKQNGGGLFRAIGDYSLKDVTVCGNNLSNSVAQNPILVDVTSLDNCNFSNNDLRVTGTGRFHATHKAPITIHADTMNLVRVDDNTIANTSSLTKAVEIVARNSSEKGSMRGNMTNYGTFIAPETFIVDGNT